MSQQLENDTYHTQRLYEPHTFPHASINKQPPNQTFFDFNQSILELFRFQTELTHSTQGLCQQTIDALNNIAKSSLLQENQHFINDITMEQIDKVTSLTNKDPFKPALAKSQGSFSRTISSYPPILGWNKIKEWLCYKFGSVATKHQAVSMLTDQQQKPSATLQEYIQRFSDLLLKPSRLLLHQAKDLAHITHFIQNLHNHNLQHYMLGKNPTSVQNTIMLAQKQMQNYALLKVYITTIQAMKSIIFTPNKIIIKIT